MAQPVVPNPWGSSNVPELPSLNPHLSHVAMNDSGTSGYSGPTNMQNPTSHGVSSEQTGDSTSHVPRGPHDAASGLDLLDAHMFEPPIPNGDYALPQEQFTPFRSQYLNSNVIFPNMQNQFGGSVNMPNSEQLQYGNNGHQWSDHSHAGHQRPSVATGQVASPAMSPPNQYYQTIFPQTLQQYVPYPMPTPVSHATNNQSVSSSALRMDVPAVSSPNRQASFRPRQFSQFPQAGVTPATIHHRRQHRTHSIASSVPSVQQQHTRTSSQNLHVRSRPPVRDTNYLNIPTPQIPGSHAARLAIPPSEMAPGETPYPPPLTAQERGELARRLHMRELLRSAQSSESHALHYYEENYLRPQRRQLEEAVSHSRGLDDQKDGRPEPKEDKDLTVNLECKICMSQLVDTVLIPCGHAILCRWCAEQHTRPDRSRPKASVLCPLCRAPVKQKIRIYLS
ncbi:hypothetical protein BDV29DRAFT_155177 [Aspergillus leporis]|uniref:RING-type domain-containing protein n=1 Tax=Aspergillus leporis TaxID=41062 RepID=A0A5N5X5J1_9EURO|nr:hypothetical protein BDV29DRAFT_155177 [Aspergillus leporis]